MGQDKQVTWRSRAPGILFWFYHLYQEKMISKLQRVVNTVRRDRSPREERRGELPGRPGLRMRSHIRQCSVNRGEQDAGNLKMILVACPSFQGGKQSLGELPSVSGEIPEAIFGRCL